MFHLCMLGEWTGTLLSKALVIHVSLLLPCALCSCLSHSNFELTVGIDILWMVQWQKCQRSKVLVIHVLLHLISWYQNHSLKKLSPFWKPGQMFLDHVLMKWGQPQNRDKFWKFQFWLMNSRNGDNMGVKWVRFCWKIQHLHSYLYLKVNS
jgi:hypothetical protein